ncbi:hypothetical protein [Hydrogenophaga sp. 5NK40-0174]|uniref:hypothetical protein n=1 Tax=Hydrogenophaga sp. 5NK40-0174 TaxID=3127649 RepID=UPI00310576F8
MNATSKAIHSTFESVEKAADQTATATEGLIESTRVIANGALDKAEASVKKLHKAAPRKLGSAATQVDEFAQRRLAQAKAVQVKVRETANDYTEKAASKVREKPLQSVLMAAAAGATVATLVTMAKKRKLAS